MVHGEYESATYTRVRPQVFANASGLGLMHRPDLALHPFYI